MTHWNPSPSLLFLSCKLIYTLFFFCANFFVALIFQGHLRSPTPGGAPIVVSPRLQVPTSMGIIANGHGAPPPLITPHDAAANAAAVSAAAAASGMQFCRTLSLYLIHLFLFIRTKFIRTLGLKTLKILKHVKNIGGFYFLKNLRILQLNSLKV